MQDNYDNYESYLNSLILLNNFNDDKNYERGLEAMNNIVGDKFNSSNALLSQKNKLYTDIELLAWRVSNIPFTNYMCYDAINIATDYKHLKDEPEAQQYFDILANCIIHMANGACALEWVKKIGTHLLEMAALVISTLDIFLIMEWTTIKNDYFGVMEAVFLELAKLDDLVYWVLVHNNNIDKCEKVKYKIILYYSDYFIPDTKYNGAPDKYYRGLWRSDLYRDMPEEYNLGVLL